MRYIIYGAGGIGGTLGARLFEAGRETVLVARGDHGRAIAAHGLRFGTPEGWRTLHVAVVGHPRELALSANDVVVLAMKSQDTNGALDALVPIAPPEIAIVCAQNGVENERRCLRRFANVHGMRVMMAAVYLEPGVVHQHNPPFGAVCDVGRVPGGTDAIDAVVAADLQAAGLDATVCADVMSRKYAKLISNLTNVIEAASGPAAYTSGISARARDEAYAVYAAAGIVAEGPNDMRTAMHFGDVDGVSRPGGSTLQSLARGATSLEVDDLNGEIVLLGRLHGVPTPVNAMLQRLAVRLIAQHAAPGSIPIEELERAIA